MWSTLSAGGYRQRRAALLLLAASLLPASLGCSSSSSRSSFDSEDGDEDGNDVIGSDVIANDGANDNADSPGDDANLSDMPDAAGMNPPGPPPSLTLPDDLASNLLMTEEGLPILLEAPPDALGQEVRVQLVYDETLDDPITAYGDCLSRLVSCRVANPDGTIAGCIDQIETCETNAGGRGCCPSTCIADFQTEVGNGTDEDLAIEQTFLLGECFDGLIDFRDEFGDDNWEVMP